MTMLINAYYRAPPSYTENALLNEVGDQLQAINADDLEWEEVSLENVLKNEADEEFRTEQGAFLLFD